MVIFLESAELRAKNRQDLTMDFWRVNVDRILEFQDKAVLGHAGSISNAEMERMVRAIYERFDQRRKTAEAQAADAQDIEDLKALEEEIKNKKAWNNTIHTKTPALSCLGGFSILEVILPVKNFQELRG